MTVNLGLVVGAVALAVSPVCAVAQNVVPVPMAGQPLQYLRCRPTIATRIRTPRHSLLPAQMLLTSAFSHRV